MSRIFCAYNIYVQVEFDPAKDRANRARHGVSLAEAARFDFGSALLRLDDRFDYGEDRWQALGFIDDRLFMLVFAEIEHGFRAISLRKATRQEATFYDQRQS